MLVQDRTPQYSPLGRWAGLRGLHSFAGYGDVDWGNLITGISTAVKNTVDTVTNVVKTTQAGQGGTSPTQGTVSPGGSLNFGPQQAAPQKAWYQDPLMLGAAGLGVVGLLFVLKGGRGRAMGGFGSYRRRRRSRR